MFFVLFGCAGPGPEDLELHQDAGLQSSAVETSLEVTVDQLDIPYEGSPEQALLDEAETRGLNAIFEKWLNSGFIFQPKDCPGEEQSDFTFIRREGQFSADFDEVTGNYSFAFRLLSDFQACRHLSGKIVRLEEEKSITAPYQTVILRLQKRLPGAQKPYFLIAKEEAIRGNTILRLIGSGQIQDCLGRFALGKILKVRREIKAGNHIFLVPLSIEPIVAPEEVPEQSPGPEQTAAPDVDEVVVQPKMEPEEKSMPLEPK